MGKILLDAYHWYLAMGKLIADGIAIDTLMCEEELEMFNTISRNFKELEKCLKTYSLV